MCQPGRPRPQGLFQPHSLAPRPFPKGKIQWVAFFLVPLDACAHLQFVDLAPRELSVLGEAANAEIDIARAVLSLDNVATVARDDGFNEIDYVRDAFAHLGLVAGGKTAHLTHQVLIHIRHFCRQLQRRDALLFGTIEDFVVDVRDVPHVRDVKAQRT